MLTGAAGPGVILALASFGGQVDQVVTAAVCTARDEERIAGYALDAAGAVEP